MRPADDRNASALCPMMLAQMSAIVATDTSGATGITARTTRGVAWCSPTPSNTGNKTTCTVLRNSPQASTGTSVPASHFVSTGVITIAPIVEHIVISTDKATFARAMYVTTFDAVPPGQHPTRISPTASGVGNAST